MSTFWKILPLLLFDATSPARITSGVESAYALDIPVIVFVKPGPDVTRTIPGLLLTLA